MCVKFSATLTVHHIYVKGTGENNKHLSDLTSCIYTTPTSHVCRGFLLYKIPRPVVSSSDWRDVVDIRRSKFLCIFNLFEILGPCGGTICQDSRVTQRSGRIRSKRSSGPNEWRSTEQSALWELEICNSERNEERIIMIGRYSSWECLRLYGNSASTGVLK